MHMDYAKMQIPCADQQCYTAKDRQQACYLLTLHKDYELLRLSDKHVSEDVPSRIYRVSMGSQHNRKPFLSVGGLGLAPTHAKPGDHICIIFGATVSFILSSVAVE